VAGLVATPYYPVDATDAVSAAALNAALPAAIVLGVCLGILEVFDHRVPAT
jgi:hypothetical protein